ncbi:polysaccharide deacetylase family protein [Granulicoccus sp. GXG6511]|uniref:polysaccharide deacetylase family protein n=1 Tax=Granulicoccus sp. GXG6511 TaxID=3381351 RepID=UPI003D7E7AA4
MRTLSLRSLILAVCAVLAVTTVGCAPSRPVTAATPAPSITSSEPEPTPSVIPAPGAATADPTPSAAEPEQELAVPAARAKALTRVVLDAPSPSPRGAASNAAGSSSARRNPPPPGSVDCSVHKCIALTFDDGPGPHTSRLLGMLTSKGARATFFMQGVAIRANPGIARQVANTPGMELGDHSSTHPQLDRVGAAQLRREIVGNHATIEEITGKDVTVFRPPYGARNSAVDAMAAEAGEAVILWDLDTSDWRTRSAPAIRSVVQQRARSGSIVLMHDIHGSTVDAVPGIIDDLQSQGYVLVTVSELLGGTHPGRVYSRR